MSYRIQYQPAEKEHRKEYPNFRRAILTIMCFALFLVLVRYSRIDAIEVMNHILDQLRPTIVVSSMDQMAEAFKNGVHIQSVLETFIHNLIQEA